MKNQIRALLNKYNLRPKKGLGQNFLVREDILDRIAEAGVSAPDEAVLEIGPGLGGLTVHLAERARAVVAVEIDERLLAPLEEVVGDLENVRVVLGDILAQDIPALMSAAAPYRVAANIPYYITSPIIRHLLESGHPPRSLVLTVQREVAERICAEPPKMNLLALSVGVYGAPETLFRVPASAFYPRPRVDSAVVRIEPYPQPLFKAEAVDLFFRLAKAGFGQKRKTLRNSLSAGMGWTKDEAAEILAAAGVDHMRRAETLGFEEWGRIVEIL